MPRLRVVAGPSMAEATHITVNTGESHRIVSDSFDGHILAYIKDLPAEDGSVVDSEYFGREDRKGVTWSIQVQGVYYVWLECISGGAMSGAHDYIRIAGRFLRPISADDVLFGNTFERPLNLPWGASAAFRFMKYALLSAPRTLS